MYHFHPHIFTFPLNRSKLSSILGYHSNVLPTIIFSNNHNNNPQHILSPSPSPQTHFQQQPNLLLTPSPPLNIPPIHQPYLNTSIHHSTIPFLFLLQHNPHTNLIHTYPINTNPYYPITATTHTPLQKLSRPHQTYNPILIICFQSRKI